VKQAKFPGILVSPEQKSDKKTIDGSTLFCRFFIKSGLVVIYSQKYIFQHLTAFKTRL
jgi:hypothetical protein